MWGGERYRAAFGKVEDMKGQRLLSASGSQQVGLYISAFPSPSILDLNYSHHLQSSFQTTQDDRLQVLDRLRKHTASIMPSFLPSLGSRQLQTFAG